MASEVRYRRMSDLETLLAEIHVASKKRFEDLQGTNGLLGWNEIQESEWILETVSKLKHTGDLEQRIAIAREVLRALQEDRLRAKTVGLSSWLNMTWGRIKARLTKDKE